MRQRTITGLGLAAVAVAQLLPAFREGTRVTPGWAATLLAMAGLDPFFNSDPSASHAELAACVAGTLANLCLLLALIAGFADRSRLGTTFAGLALAAGLVSVGAMFGVGDQFLPLAGCAAWLGSMLWLTLASVLVTERDLESPAIGLPGYESEYDGVSVGINSPYETLQRSGEWGRHSDHLPPGHCLKK